MDTRHSLTMNPRTGRVIYQVTDAKGSTYSDLPQRSKELTRLLKEAGKILGKKQGELRQSLLNNQKISWPLENKPS